MNECVKVAKNNRRLTGYSLAMSCQLLFHCIPPIASPGVQTRYKLANNHPQEYSVPVKTFFFVVESTIIRMNDLKKYSKDTNKLQA